MWNLKKKWYNELIYKTEIDSQMQKTNIVMAEEGYIGRLGVTYTYTLLNIKQITNKDMLYSTGNSTQYSVVADMGKESKKEWRHV